eukprot:TRINITY_DN3856_c0_g1_i1.p1 TRINITY_DN3856_c0_g1~~TRINITY_DN3856_c0_g1_i1.p1  ORF type:complete len:352 (+),score=55.77 TRINITY_DN3856_c0_g1_i1:917-1972(+)
MAMAASEVVRRNFNQRIVNEMVAKKLHDRREELLKNPLEHLRKRAKAASQVTIDEFRHLKDVFRTQICDIDHDALIQKLKNMPNGSKSGKSEEERTRRNKEEADKASLAGFKREEQLQCDHLRKCMRELIAMKEAIEDKRRKIYLLLKDNRKAEIRIEGLLNNLKEEAMKADEDDEKLFKFSRRDGVKRMRESFIVDLRLTNLKLNTDMQTNELKREIQQRLNETLRIANDIKLIEEKISSFRLQKLELRIRLRDLYAKMLRLHYWQYPENENYSATYFIKGIWKVLQHVREEYFPGHLIDRAGVDYLIEVASAEYEIEMLEILSRKMKNRTKDQLQTEVLVNDKPLIFSG